MQTITRRGRLLVVLGLASVAQPQVALSQVAAPAPNATDVFSRLSERYTEAQRVDYFDREVKGKRVRWSVQVVDVSTGWWAYTVQGRVAGNEWNALEVWCEVKISDQTRFILDLQKGMRVICDGVPYGYAKIIGTVIYMKDASITK